MAKEAPWVTGLMGLFKGSRPSKLLLFHNFSWATEQERYAQVHEPWAAFATCSLRGGYTKPGPRHFENRKLEAPDF